MLHLDILSLVRLSQVSKRFYLLFRDKAVWREIDLDTLPCTNVRKMKKIIKEKLPSDLYSIKITSNASNSVQKKTPPVVTPDVLNELFIKCPGIRRISLTNCDLREVVSTSCLLLKSLSMESVTFRRCLTLTRWLAAAQWPKLTYLSLASTTKTSLVDLKIIAETPSWVESLTALDLSCCYQVNDEGVKVLTTLRKLRVLVLSQTNITNAALHTMKSFPSLRGLQVDGIKGLTDEGIQKIPSLLPCLTQLNISNLPNVSGQAVTVVTKMLPNAKVTF